MRMLINGIEGNDIGVPAGADKTVNIMLLADDGSLIPSTAETWSLEVYDTQTRKNAATFSVALTTVTAAAGFGTMAITATNSALMTKGGRYYAFAKRIDAGTKVAFSDKCCTIEVE